MANRLIDEKSPYLLQHAHNPVDWYPWGEEAFEKARQEDKPIFLSIGYSTCHWCHVMERESFENEKIAALMNELYVNIKVDREERPDVDRVYMTTVQALTGHGGWPLSVWLTPNLKPFFGGTYFPPEPLHGRPGFPETLQSISDTWKQRRQEVEASSEKIFQTLTQQGTASIGADGIAAGERAESLNAALDRGYAQFSRSFDGDQGGFSSAPKFPRPSTFNFLLRYWARSGKGPALRMTLDTLEKMWAGGMYDHLGGGFHRYSVDAFWRVPHFEKMLYDQAQLVLSYLEAFQITGDRFFAEVATNILDYVLRDMTDSAGGFYSAEDADSAMDPARPDEKEEGAFYIWTRDEITEILDGDTAPVLLDTFGVTEAGNSISDPTGELGNRNVLYQALTSAQAAQRFDRSETEITEVLERGKAALLEARAQRPRPHLDDKIITAWNGLMISAFARASRVVDDDRYITAATRAAEFLEEELYDRDSDTLLRRYRDGEARHPAHLEDYAYLTQGLLDLYEADFDERWLEWATRLTQSQNEKFWDREGVGYYDTSGEDDSIILRTREVHDGAEPSGNSVAANNLLRLGWILDRPEWRELAERTIGAVSGLLETSPVAMPQMLATVGFASEPPQQIVLVGSADAEETQEMVSAVYRRFLPRKILLLVEGGDAQRLGKASDFYGSLERLEGKTTAYICENYACRLPTNDVAQLEHFLDGKE
ncbi:MAG: thioredoxin domain-containing protein [Thermoanaerobaculia bacterium]